MSVLPLLEQEAATSVLTEDRHHHLSLQPIRLRDRLLARLHAGNLDSQLAAGATIESRKLRAVRASLLVSPQERERLACAWTSVLHRSTRESAPDRAVTSARIPLRSDEVRDAAVEIEQLTAVLRSSRPVSARGVAMANLLLIDGGGPLYSADCHRSLAYLVAEAARELDSVCL